ncbi:Methyltransferase-like protein [Mycena venus]|uniref:tRNA N(3)-methylcytidine methyltransferase n=1 Tax=Mycena venus TaxID=2733690 RepID=A0A8H7D0I5_9AGAR|nr:Methyltransferase-like protein [Mycena venus]
MDPQASTSSSNTKQTSSVHDIASEKPPFGSRFLTDEANVWTQNAWDHVPPPDDQDEIIAASLLKQRSAPVPEDDKQKYNERPARHWDNFYRMMASNFFRDRKWLHNEFRELMSATEPEAGPITILEVGCGTGAAMFPPPLLKSKSKPLAPRIRLLPARHQAFPGNAHALLKENELYKAPPCGTIEAGVWDLTSDSLPEGVEPESADIVIMVFVFSALHPDEWIKAVSNVYKILKPGGLVLFRDYGRYDMAQLRFKGGRLLDENFYIRGDKTRVYFFELDELALLFTGARAEPSNQRPIVTQIVEDESEDGGTTSSIPGSEEIPAPTFVANPQPPQIHPSLLSSPPPALFATEQLGVDRRLLLNRKRQVKMYRVWMQAKFRKLDVPGTNTTQ